MEYLNFKKIFPAAGTEPEIVRGEYGEEGKGMIGKGMEW